MSEKMKEDVPEGRNKTDALLLSIARSHGHLGQIANVTTTWKKLCQELSEPSVDNIKTAKFLRLPLEEQHKRKNRGYFVGGPFKGHARKKTEMVNRSVLTFDIDQCGLNLLDELLDPMLSSIAGYEYQVHSTRSHSPEKPRIRLVIPLDKPIPLEQYDPLMRIIAFQLDPTMETVAPESFALPQAMFLPTRSSDQEFVNYRNATGKLLSAEEHFKTWPEPWTTYDRLPVSAREMKARRAHDKAPDPRTKPGIIGAWCRIYSIRDVIHNFLSDVYVPGDEADRYSYLPGHTRNGAIIYDEDTYLYSHHGTDPCGGKLVNGWDLYRIHKFGHLDSVDAVEVAEGNITKLPSHKAMLEFARTDEVVVRESGAAYYDEDAIIADMLADEDEDEVVSPPVKAVDDDKWKDQLERYDTSGKYLPTYSNIRLILENDNRLKGCFAYNDFNERPVIRKRIRSKHVGLPPIHNKVHGDGITEHVLVAVRTILEGTPKDGGYGLKTTERDINDAIQAVISKNHFHPVKNFLRSVKWDGKPRLRKLLSRYFKAEDTELHEVFSFNFMVGAVQRAFEPGCKFDYVLILRGPQGIRKSGGLRALAGSSFFGELTTPKLEDRAKVVEQLAGKWIVEVPELSQFNRSEVEVIKSLFSAQDDYVRLAWGKGGARTYLRKNVFGGTSNSEKFLKDDTGNRRFWPVVLTEQVDTAAIERDRDQLWAEAYQEYLRLSVETDHEVLPLGVPEHLQAEVASIQEEHQEKPYEVLAAQISEWLDTPVPKKQTALGWRPTAAYEGEETYAHTDALKIRQKTCLKDIAEVCLNLPKKDFNVRLQRDILAALRSLPNWKPGKRERFMGGGDNKVRVFHRKKVDNI